MQLRIAVNIMNAELIVILDLFDNFPKSTTTIEKSIN